MPTAIQSSRGDGLFVTQLVFGRDVPANPGGKESIALSMDASVSITRIQNFIVRIDAWPKATEQLLQGIDVAALNGVAKP